jgi:hypothetical protein
MNDQFAMAHFSTAKCRSCGAYIVWLKTSTGKNMPVDADSLDEAEIEHGERPVFDAKEGHISHFATCPDAGKFRKRDKK